jgi:hypothetical protein
VEDLEKLVQDRLGVRVVAAETLVGAPEVFDVPVVSGKSRDVDAATAMTLFEGLDHLTADLVRRLGQQSRGDEVGPELTLEIEVMTSKLFELRIRWQATVFGRPMLPTRTANENVFRLRRGTTGAE